MSDEINPYQSPVPGQEEPASAAEPTAPIDSSRPPFVPATRWAIATSLCLVLALLSEAACLFYYAQLYQYYIGIADPAEIAPDTEDYLYSFTYVPWTCALVMHYVTGASLIYWMYRAHRNLQPLGHSKLEFKAVWGLICWFIPIVELFFPYLVMREIWWRSDPTAGNTRESARPSDLVFWWWMAWISSRMIEYLAWWLVSPDWSLPNTLFHLRCMLALGILRSVAGVLLLCIIYGIDRNQRERHRRILSGDLVLPPLPSDE